MASQTFLITGATGRQGGAVVRALLDRAVSPQPNILAVTRNPDSGSAKRLAALSSNVSLVKGDLEDSASIFKNVPKKPDSVFLVTMPIFGLLGSDVASEERQGKAFADAASQAGVKHLVFSSIDRGGPARSKDNPTYVPHFVSKHHIEKHIEQKAQESGMQYTFLRTVAYMDNCTDDFGGKIFSTAILGSFSPDRKVNLLSVDDIGFFAADALLKPDEYRDFGISIAGDYLTKGEAQQIFKEVVGRDMPMTYWLIARLLLWLNRGLNLMVKWFQEEAVPVDLEEVRRRHPDVSNWATFLRTKSDFQKL